MFSLLRAIFENQVVAFIIVVGVVIFVHEFGHFIVARIFGIRVEEFSLGFGPRAFGVRRGGTDYKICWLPLGGYVKLYGAEIGSNIPLEHREIAISTAALYKRVLVSAAGPGMNFVLTFFVMAMLSVVGIEKLPAQISVVPGSIAHSAGLPDGAVIRFINGASVRTWEDLSERISENGGKKLQVDFLSEGVNGKVTLVPAASEDETVYGEKVKVGRIGVTPYFLSPTVAVRKDGSLSAVGMRTYDKVVTIGDEPVLHFHQIPQKLAKISKKMEVEKTIATIPVVVERSGAKVVLQWPARLLEVNEQTLSDLGIVSTDLMLAAPKKPIVSGTSAFQWSACGAIAGFVITSIDGYGPVRSRVQIVDWIERSERALGERVPVSTTFESVLRGFNAEGDLIQLNCAVTARLGRDHLNRKKLFIDFPDAFETRSHTAEPILLKSSGFFEMLDNGAKLTLDMAKNIVDGVSKLITGRIPFSNLGGPVEIARVAGSAAKVGWQAFVGMIAFISINVGILNLLPIPVLDGGTLLLLGAEAAYGKSLPVRVQEFVLRAGVFFIFILVILVLYNDVLRRLAHD